MSDGWIKVHRRIERHWLWEDPSKLKAWLDLLLLANWETRKILFQGELLEIERGSFVTSKLKLSARWRWSRTKTDEFLDTLQREQMLLVKSDNRKTYISIVKYDTYQNSDAT